MKLKTSLEFDSAHRLVGYSGKCSNLHGHIWHVDIEVDGCYEDVDSVGILWDFTNVKKIKDMFDHKTILKECDENVELIEAIRNSCGEDSLYLMNDNPTAENLCSEILKICKDLGFDLDFNIKVWESPKSYAEIEG
jgi:6-pyruvoyltetrahydropterin/6-carboxytetrahydropterin synthase